MEGGHNIFEWGCKRDSKRFLDWPIGMDAETEIRKDSLEAKLK